MKKFKNEFGRSMMEMLLYLGLIIVLGVSTMKLYAESTEKSKRINAQNQILDLKKDINTLYIGRAFPTIDFEGKLKDKGLVLINPWGDTINIIAKNSPTGGTGAFALPYFGIKMKLSKARCVALASALEEDTIGINVKNTTSISDNANSFEDILKNCKDGNTVTFWMKKE